MFEVVCWFVVFCLQKWYLRFVIRSVFDVVGSLSFIACGLLFGGCILLFVCFSLFIVLLGLVFRSFIVVWWLLAGVAYWLLLVVVGCLSLVVG